LQGLERRLDLNHYRQCLRAELERADAAPEGPEREAHVEAAAHYQAMIDHYVMMRSDFASSVDATAKARDSKPRPQSRADPRKDQG
jgi:hypothetical protein